MADTGGEEEAEASGSLEQVGKALDPYLKRLPKSAMAGVGGAGVITIIHRLIPTDFPPLEHAVIDWAIGGGVIACIGLIVRGVYRLK